MQNLFEGWRGFLLLEGRKENAAIAIVKKINDRYLIRFLHSMATNPENVHPSLSAADPTPNKKYIEWAARRINDYARKEESDEYLQAYAKADEDPNAFEAPPGSVYTPGRLEQILSLSQDDQIKAGYIINADKAQRNRDDAKVNIINIYSKISGNLLKYHRFAQRGLMDKNIDKYKEIHEWEHEVYKAEREDAERQKMKVIEKGAKETTDYLHDDDAFMLVRPRSEEGACYYGRGTRWCISATTSRNYFQQYTGEGTGFYFVMFKNLPQDDPYKKMALVYTAGDTEEPNEVFDAEDDEVGIDALREAVQGNILAGALKKSLGSELKKLKGDLRQKYFKERFEVTRDVYENLEDLLDGELWSDYKPVGASLELSKEAKRSWQLIKSVINELGLDDEDLSVAIYEDIEEHIMELTSEQYHNILGYSSGHWEETPAGPSGAEFEAIHDKYASDLSHVYISYDEYEDAKWYWDGGFSVDFKDIHEDLEHADEDEVAYVFLQILDSHHVYPSESEVHNGEMMARFSPDYDEQEGLDSFEAFCSRMSEHDEAIHKILDEDLKDTIETFMEAKLIAGITMRGLKSRFDELDLENFEIDIEENELSVYVTLPITVPMPQHLYVGLTAETPTWTDLDRAQVATSEDLKAYAQMIKDRTKLHSDVLIKQLQAVFDNVFELYVKKLEATLPGLGPPDEAFTPAEEARELASSPRGQESVGFAVPDYNISIYPRAADPRVGASGLLMSYFFDVRIEADEAEEEGTVNLIGSFLRTIDKESTIEKIRVRFESIVVNDVIKNVMPNFEEGKVAPTIDPRTGKVLSDEEKEATAREQLQGMMASDIGEERPVSENLASPLTENKKRLRIFINKIG